MAFGNYIPNYYNPAPYQQPQISQLPQMPQQNNGILWVQGEAGSKAYPVAPGASVLLMDSESKTMYLKGADQSGMPFMRIFDYNERTQQTAPQNLQVEYVTKTEFEKLANMVKELKEGKHEQSDI